MAERNERGEALTALILEIFRINGELLSAGNLLTKPMGLTSARWQVLGAIDEEGQPLTVSQIARRMGLARQGVQRLINELEKAGLVTSSPNLDHKRAPLFALSNEGRRTMATINEAQAVWVNALSADLSIDALSQARELLEMVRERSENTN